MAESRTSIGGTVNINQGSINFCNLDDDGATIERGVRDSVTLDDVNNPMGIIARSIHGCPAINQYRAQKKSMLKKALRNGHKKNKNSNHQRRPIDKACGAAPPKYETVEVDNIKRNVEESKDPIPTNGVQADENVSFGDSISVQEVNHGIVPVKEFIKERAKIELIIRDRDELGDVKNLNVGNVSQNDTGDIELFLNPDLAEVIKDRLLEIENQLMDFINFGQPGNEVSRIGSLIEIVDGEPILEISTLFESLEREGGSTIGFSGLNPDVSSRLGINKKSGEEPELKAEFSRRNPETGQTDTRSATIQGGSIRTRSGRIRVEEETGNVVIENSVVTGKTNTIVKAITSDFLSDNYLNANQTNELINVQANRITTVKLDLDQNYYRKPIVDNFIDDLETQISKLGNNLSSQYITATVTRKTVSDAETRNINKINALDNKLVSKYQTSDTLNNRFNTIQNSVNTLQNTLFNQYYNKTSIDTFNNQLQNDIDIVETDLGNNYYTKTEVENLVGGEVGNSSVVNTTEIRLLSTSSSDVITIFDPLATEIVEINLTDSSNVNQDLDFNLNNYFRINIQSLLSGVLNINAVNLKAGQTGVIYMANYSLVDDQEISFSSSLKFSIGTRPLVIPKAESVSELGWALFSYSCPNNDLALCTGLSGFE